MNPAAATFWTGIGCLILGWVAFWLLVHRPDRAVQQAIHADALAEKDDVIAAKDDRIEILETSNENLGHSCDNLMSRVVGANVKLAKSRRMNDENIRIIHEVNEVTSRRHWLPTISGNYLDTVANLPVGFRLDWAEFGSETPIGMGVLSDHIADVVPISKGAK